MLNDIKNKLTTTIKRFSDKYEGQVNLNSSGAQEELANELIREIWDTNVTLNTVNKDQLELFSNLEQGEHK